MDDYRKAINYFRRAVRSNPEDAQAWLALGNSYFDYGRLSSARRAYMHGIRCCSKSEHDPETLCVLYYNIGNVFLMKRIIYRPSVHTGKWFSVKMKPGGGPESISDWQNQFQDG
jgi:tetratricopeptide (TPR) repeat protein